MTEISNIFNPSVRANFKREGRTISVWSSSYKTPAELENETKRVFTLVEDFVSSGEYFRSGMGYVRTHLQELVGKIREIANEIEDLDMALRNCRDYVSRQLANDEKSQLTHQYRELKASYNELKYDRYLIQQKNLSENTLQVTLANLEPKLQVLQELMDSVQQRSAHVFDDVAPMTEKTIIMKKQRSALNKELAKLLQDEWYNSQVSRLLQRLTSYYNLEGRDRQAFNISYDRHKDAIANATPVFVSNIIVQDFINSKSKSITMTDDAIRVLTSTLVDKVLLEHKIVRVHTTV